MLQVLGIVMPAATLVAAGTVSLGSSPWRWLAVPALVALWAARIAYLP